MAPPWLEERPEHFARVLGFFDNEIEGRSGDSRISAAIAFEEPITFEGLTGSFGHILGRWEGQTWDGTGVVHVHLCERPVHSAQDVAEVRSAWLESHASYEVVAN
jgi:hypothetical protein